MSETKKHKEFWIYHNLYQRGFSDVYELPLENFESKGVKPVHVIEASALLEEKQKIEELNMHINKLVYVVKEIHNQACQHDEGISSLWLENMTQDILKEMGELK